MVELQIAAFSTETRNATLAKLGQSLGLASGNLAKNEFGKPFLQTPSGNSCGLAITHIRHAVIPFSLMVASKHVNIGLDAEIWPRGLGDDIFLRSIMAPEEITLAKAISQQGCDAGIFLWVGKEAALKASGQVMVDPRDIALSHVGKNLLRSATSKSATFKVVGTAVAFFTLTAETGEKILVAAAVGDAPQPIQAIEIADVGKLLNLAPLNLNLS